MILNCSSYVAPLSRHDASCYSGPCKLLTTHFAISPTSSCSFTPKPNEPKAFGCAALRAFSPLHLHLLSLCLSLVRIYSFLAPPPLSLHSISPDNEASLAHRSDQSASVFLSDCVCVCIVWLEQLQMLLKQERWCILLSVHYEIEKKIT